jgi:hypothetical protein
MISTIKYIGLLNGVLIEANPIEKIKNEKTSIKHNIILAVLHIHAP